VSAGKSSSPSVLFLYRHVNQAERFERSEMNANGNTYRASIPAAYTATPYPLQYYFVLTTSTDAHLYPGLGADLMGQPYFVLQRM
jgi:hypothetical protein